MKVSIIIPVFNSFNYLEQCVNSALNQSYKDIEILLIDDGSTDGSESICDYYASLDTRVKTYHLSNQGVSHARNFGIAKANGDYISFLDADDLMDQTMIEMMIGATNNGKIDIVQCGFKTIKINGSCLKEYLYDYDNLASCNFVNYLFHPHKYISNNVWTKLIKRSVCTSIKFNEKLKIGEDFLFVIDALLISKSIRIIPNLLYVYYKRSGSATNSTFSLKEFDDFDIDDYLLNRFNSSSYLKKLINGRDAKRCVEIYVSAFKCFLNKKYKKFIISRLKSDKHRVRLSFRYEISIFLLVKVPVLFDCILSICYRRNSNKYMIKG